ncbi:MAG: BlaI/MecI/CopY family transcriptional regulator [Bryobacteraceae bacterium]|nr:BlaI/MecI/CopY family transcriptional regulator [Bryobacteraceae bacterium]
MRSRKPVPTEQELELLKIIWRRGEATVRDVYEELLEQRKIAYTTVMTMMGILEEKGHLTKSQGEKAYVYRPTQPRSRVVGNMVADFLNRVFDGSAKPLLVHLVESDQLSKEEIKEIRQLLNRKERTQ